MDESGNNKVNIGNDDDVNAVNKVLNGNTLAFKFIEKKYKKIITILIRKMIKNEDDVQDLVQETFIKTYNSLTTYQQAYPFSSWIYKIASNHCIDFLRKKRFQTISLSQPISNTDDEYFLEIEDTSYMPDINLLNEERQNAVKKALDRLPENFRYIIKLRHEDDMDYVQIAEHLNIPLGTVKARLFRARKLLLMDLKRQQNLFI